MGKILKWDVLKSLKDQSYLIWYKKRFRSWTWKIREKSEISEVMEVFDPAEIEGYASPGKSG